ncbi:MAG: FxsA family protein [Neomegalonema sp.]|nr:FxsA family protein [Neomegalonema sp.]
MRLFFVLLLVPIVEISLFVVIGGRIGLWWTLAIVAATALIGATAIRAQGRRVLQRIGQLESLNDAGSTMINGVMIAVAGLLLLTPGFLTDTFGLLLLTPWVRSVLEGVIKKHVIVVAQNDMRARAGFAAETADREPEPTPSSASLHSETDQPDRSQSEEAPRRPTGRPERDADDAIIIDSKN